MESASVPDTDGRRGPAERCAGRDIAVTVNKTTVFHPDPTPALVDRQAVVLDPDAVTEQMRLGRGFAVQVRLARRFGAGGEVGVKPSG